jgi:hypothetical protein
MEYISEQQQKIVCSPEKYKLINGCAGSNKTDTLIKCAIKDLEKNKRPILFLTLVGSVTDEIKNRLEKCLGIDILKQGSSNHYLGYFSGIPICISNFDAWVHLMLTNEEMEDIGDCYSEKTDILLKKTQSENSDIACVMKGGYNVGLLIIDEAQDLRSVKMNIITNMITKQTDLDVYIAGDYLQTLFTEDNSNFESIDAHAMNIFKRISPKYFDLNICMRCPKAHVDFNNLIVNDIQKKYCIPNMQSNNNNIDDKPVLFTHLATSNSNTNARINAEQVAKMIKILMEQDTSIIPNDIAIIMAKSKDNQVFFHLENILNNFYTSKGWKDSVYYMNTEGDGKHNTLDWNKATGKTKLLSIHGDKGRGHKVVFFLGLTEGSIPRDIFIYKPSEIIPESLLNVGLTRSLKYLFIGFTYSFPSRYLWRQKNVLNKYTYCSWEKSQKIPEPYASIIKNDSYTHNPIWSKEYKKEKIVTGNKSILEIKNDISKDFEQAKNLIMHPWKKEERKIQFGNKQNIDMILQEEHYMLLGVMTELLIQRIICKEKIFNQLREGCDPNKIIYTDDERFLSCMYDLQNRSYDNSLQDFLKEYHNYLEKNIDVKDMIINAYTNKKKVIHSVFKSLNFKKDLEIFFSKCENAQIKTESIWNVTLFWNQITQKIYRPAVNTFISFFSENINILHKNIDMYIAQFNLHEHNILLEQSLYVGGAVSKNDLPKLNKENHTVSIAGRYDLFDFTVSNLIEMKASVLTNCSQQWIIQSLGYALLLDIIQVPVKKITIVNILSGCLWEWDIPKLPSLEILLQTKLSKKYNWHKIETQTLISYIEEKRIKHFKNGL